MNWDITSANRILRAPIADETTSSGCVSNANISNPDSIWTVQKTNITATDKNNDFEEIEKYVDSQGQVFLEKYLDNGKLEKSLEFQQVLSASSIANIGAIGGRINNSIKNNIGIMQAMWVKETINASFASSLSEAKNILQALEDKLRELDNKNEAFLRQGESIVNINQDINSLDDKTKEKLNTNLSSYISSDEDEALDQDVIANAINTINDSVENNNQNTTNPFGTDTSGNPFFTNKKNPFLPYI